MSKFTSVTGVKNDFRENWCDKKSSRTTISRRDLTVSTRGDIDPSLLYPTYNLTVPIDHFHNETRYEPHSNETFALRYWFDATYYKPGGPVIVLQSGETDAVGRLPFLQKGILHELAVATNGIGVVLEHRYYGASIPTPDFSTENLRFLTTQQALMDEVYFARNIVFPGLEDKNLTAPHVAYIAYGGSYAGGFSAFLRKLYPDTFWGAISSSGVVEAITDYWQYFEPIRVYAEPKCIKNTQFITNSMDNIVIGQEKNTALVQELKTVWGLPNVTYTNDFMSVVMYGMWEWQSKNWDPAIEGTPYFDYYCGNVTSEELIWPSLKSSTAEISPTPTSATVPPIKTPATQRTTPPTTLKTTPHKTGASGPTKSAPNGATSKTARDSPPNILPLLSRTIDIPYLSIICVSAFNISAAPAVENINQYGGFSLRYPRLASIDGEQDVWRPATAHASPFNPAARNRTSSTSEPFLLIEGAVHHWDENGLFANQTSASLPPQTIRSVHEQEIAFVKAWMTEWRVERRRMGRALA
ncbi:hypothetical protein NHQ30_009977 [Ciborinia camelliae]|nr:hypothetical protein NHQ30_009977 [Ciborinia camelliae]